jgi:hypothetical protein
MERGSVSRMGLIEATRLKNGAVSLAFGHGKDESSVRIVSAGGLLSLPQVAKLAGTYPLKVWRAVRAGTLKATSTARGYRVTVKEAGRWGRTLKAGS